MVKFSHEYVYIIKLRTTSKLRFGPLMIRELRFGSSSKYAENCPIVLVSFIDKNKHCNKGKMPVCSVTRMPTSIMPVCIQVIIVTKNKMPMSKYQIKSNQTFGELMFHKSHN